jgi:hypothetical protein
MAFTVVIKPSSSDTVIIDTVSTMIDNDNDLNARLLGLEEGLVAGGSFESDSDGDGDPDGWTTTLYTNGAYTIITSGMATHGAKLIQFTKVIGAGNGGGEAIQNEFTAMQPGNLDLKFWYSSNGELISKVNAKLYDTDKNLVQTKELYSISDSTNFRAISASVTSPHADARFYKIQVQGALTTSFSGAFGFVRFDAIKIDNPPVNAAYAGNKYTISGSAGYISGPNIRVFIHSSTTEINTYHTVSSSGQISATTYLDLGGITGSETLFTAGPGIYTITTSIIITAGQQLIGPLITYAKSIGTDYFLTATSNFDGYEKSVEML